jgi:Ca2+-binding RTX toxin-like protein
MQGHLTKRIGMLFVSALLLPAAASTPATLAAPSCEDGPETVGRTIIGTPCDDTIHAPRGITTVFGEGGNDTLFGGRGNDTLIGGEGNDRLYGGIGDDEPLGGPGNDLVSGGFGADSTLDGGPGDDLVRGDATIDVIAETGGGTDTLSYATGVTPGFFNSAKNVGNYLEYNGFPATEPGRGAYINLALGLADNYLAPAGGGVDEEVDGTDFEIVIGTPFADYIVGTADPEVFYGGGGADVILGGGGADQIHGGAEGDSCEGDTGSTVDCETGAKEVDPRDPGSIAVGLMRPVGAGPIGLYLAGSSADDEIAVTFASNTVTFTLLPGSVGAFDSDPNSSEGCNSPTADEVTCDLTAAAPDSIVLAGLGGDDQLSATGFPSTTSVILLGNEGADELTGGETEDAVVDGTGNDVSSAGGGDDALPNNSGTDDLEAGAGDDLFVDDSVCEGDFLNGGAGVDNANWAQFDNPVFLDLNQHQAGQVGSDGSLDCEGSAEGDLATTLEGLEDIEGSSQGDTLIGDAGNNQLLGRFGADTYQARGGDDSILANSAIRIDTTTFIPDPDPTIDCGDGFDTAQIDFPENGPDAAPSDCEAVYERPPNSFRPPDTPPDPNPPAPEMRTPAAVLDTTPPGTKIRHRPRKVVNTSKKWRMVAFRFASEPGARFRCKIDRKKYGGCRSPRTYNLRSGKHAFRVFAIDAAGNRDHSPALVRFRIRRR